MSCIGLVLLSLAAVAFVCAIDWLTRPLSERRESEHIECGPIPRASSWYDRVEPTLLDDRRPPRNFARVRR